jgi:hypothetical protein
MKLIFSLLILTVTALPLLFTLETDEEAAPLSSSIILVRPARPLPRGAVTETQPPAIGNAEAVVETPSADVRKPVAQPPQAASAITPLTPAPQSASTSEASPARTVSGFVGQLVEIAFAGSGWVYLGEAEARKGVVYNSRYVKTSGQCLVFKAEAVGTYTLQFYKQDFIRDEIINEAVRLVVSETAGRTDASWTSGNVEQVVGRSDEAETTLPPATPPASGNTALVPPPAVVALASAESAVVTPPRPLDYLKQAREAYTTGKFADALISLEQFREHFPLGSDEAWWLYGQTLEASSEHRDIRSSLDYYRRLLREYPQSPLCADAYKRVAWLERYFFIQ